MSGAFTSRLRLTDLITSTPAYSYVDFIPGSAPAYLEGRLFYDNNKKSLSYYTDISGSSMEIGFETWTRVRNSTGSTVVIGSPVIISGATG